jgi:hypothetical protein
MATQCQSCFGVYEPIGRDGTPYFHVCPPITHAVVTRGRDTGLVPLTKLQATDLVRAQRGKEIVEVAVGELLPDDVRLGDVAVMRADARDETPVVTRDAKGRTTTRMKAEGKGVVDVEITPPAPVPILDVP